MSCDHETAIKEADSLVRYWLRRSSGLARRLSVAQRELRVTKAYLTRLEALLASHGLNPADSGPQPEVFSPEWYQLNYPPGEVERDEPEMAARIVWPTP